MRFRNLICVAAIISMLFAAGCASKESGLTIKQGTLQVGMEIGYPPMEYYEDDGTTLVGFDYEIAQKIAEKLDLKLEIVNTSFDGILESLDSKRYDCVISAISITPERSEKYSLTKAYVANKLCIVTSKNLGIKSPDDLKDRNVAVQTSTTALDYMTKKQNEGLKLKKLFVYDKIIQCFDELKTGRVDAVMVDSVVASYYIGKMGASKDTYSISWENTEAEPMAIALKKSSTELTAKIDKAVDEIYSEGSYATIAEKYFGKGNTVAVR